MREPLVPLWVAVLVAVAISMIGFALAYQDPAVTFLTPPVRFLLGLGNAGLGTFAVILGIRVPSGATSVSEVKTVTTTTPVTPPTPPTP